MARGNATASSSANQSQGNASQYFGNAESLYGNVVPTLESEIANPQGFTPPDEAAFETEAQQGAGGTQAAAVGQGGLRAVRTRNAGAATKAIDDAARGAGEQLSQSRLKTQLANANLKQQQQQQGIQGLENLTALETGASNTALGNVAPLVNANTNAANASWDWATDIFDPLVKAGGTAAAGAGY